ncbi:MAG: glycosyltransferase [Patescibacteria group bacterium]|nr:glycosyltransferase family 2 protein [Patescibacteria group bacterium]MDE1943994.1 glycosyltransferase [Patescibacteria group bacterium]MDE1945064.1 glycosyltransferase [Patescibacteria group bacterium]MDE2057932.1 glycosyltransferase [Patescibacteria group bacterium]
MTPLVVVIPTKNRRVLLARALASVFSQDYGPYRVVVVDDGSTDDTRAYLDGLAEPRLTIIRHEASRGVNAARNAGYRTLVEGEWAVPLDDDDYFLPGAFAIMAAAISQAPATISIIAFNIRFRSRTGEEQEGGLQFVSGDTEHDLTYAETMTGAGLRVLGEWRSALKWTLFPRYLFREDVNGFEGEWWMRVAHDGIGVRFVRTPSVIMIDWQHPGEHLNEVAARRDPRAFLRANLRVLRDHSAFLLGHPRTLLTRLSIVLRLVFRAVFGYSRGT